MFMLHIHDKGLKLGVTFFNKRLCDKVANKWLYALPMRLFTFDQGRVTHVPLTSSGSLTVEDAEGIMSPFIHDNDHITNLFVDFAGDFIPLTHRAEVRLVARMLVQYYNTYTHMNVDSEVSFI